MCTRGYRIEMQLKEMVRFRDYVPLKKKKVRRSLVSKEGKLSRND